MGQWTGRAADGGTMAVRLALASGCTAMNDTGCVVNLFDMETHRWRTLVAKSQNNSCGQT